MRSPHVNPGNALNVPTLTEHQTKEHVRQGRVSMATAPKSYTNGLPGFPSTTASTIRPIIIPKCGDCDKGLRDTLSLFRNIFSSSIHALLIRPRTLNQAMYLMIRRADPTIMIFIVSHVRKWAARLHVSRPVGSFPHQVSFYKDGGRRTLVSSPSRFRPPFYRGRKTVW